MWGRRAPAALLRRARVRRRRARPSCRRGLRRGQPARRSRRPGRQRAACWFSVRLLLLRRRRTCRRPRAQRRPGRRRAAPRRARPRRRSRRWRARRGAQRQTSRRQRRQRAPSRARPRRTGWQLRDAPREARQRVDASVLRSAAATLFRNPRKRRKALRRRCGRGAPGAVAVAAPPKPPNAPPCARAVLRQRKREVWQRRKQRRRETSATHRGLCRRRAEAEHGAQRRPEARSGSGAGAQGKVSEGHFRATFARSSACSASGFSSSLRAVPRLHAAQLAAAARREALARRRPGLIGLVRASLLQKRRRRQPAWRVATASRVCVEFLRSRLSRGASRVRLAVRVFGLSDAHAAARPRRAARDELTRLVARD